MRMSPFRLLLFKLGLVLFGFGAGFAVCTVMHPNIAPALEEPASPAFVTASICLFVGFFVHVLSLCTFMSRILGPIGPPPA
jgi:hypothetical protein